VYFGEDSSVSWPCENGSQTAVNHSEIPATFWSA
jgi:hypothetical protein